jgi:hypothetical protein
MKVLITNMTLLHRDLFDFSDKLWGMSLTKLKVHNQKN